MDSYGTAVGIALKGTYMVLYEKKNDSTAGTVYQLSALQIRAK